MLEDGAFDIQRDVAEPVCRSLRCIGLAVPGNDLFTAGPGDDFADGGPDSDEIFGESGNDTILGGTGNDTTPAAPGMIRLKATKVLTSCSCKMAETILPVVGARMMACSSGPTSCGLARTSRWTLRRKPMGSSSPRPGRCGRSTHPALIGRFRPTPAATASRIWRSR